MPLSFFISMSISWSIRPYRISRMTFEEFFSFDVRKENRSMFKQTLLL